VRNAEWKELPIANFRLPIGPKELRHADPAGRARRAKFIPHSALRTHLAFVALGSNLGDSVAVLRRAVQRLQSLSDQPLRRSSLWQSTPADCPPNSPLFVNAVVGLVPRSSETPESLLKKLQALEKEFGRHPKQVRNEPRLLDLDLVAFGAEVRDTPSLSLPHPRAHQRRFVLEPLAELAPALILPGQTRSVRQLLKGLRTAEQVRRLD
jgi:2-amino-4-hydroxy-6-hydroxymethyldihydropteridine diphosphokinase